MISYEAVLGQMEQLVQNAKGTNNEQHIREQVTAVKALCDVILGQAAEMSQQSIPAVYAASAPGRKVSPLQQTVSSTKLLERDANGDSIFDF